MQSQSSPFKITLRVRSEQEIQADIDKEIDSKRKDQDSFIQPTSAATSSRQRGDQKMGGIDNISDSQGSDDANPLMGVFEGSASSNERDVPQKERLIEPEVIAFEPERKNIEVTAKNMDTLDEFISVEALDPSYVEHAQKWIQKNKYLCKESLEEVQLRVDMFTFQLKKSEKSDTDIIREEMEAVQRRTQEVILEQKLFYYYFNNFWREKARDNVPSYVADNIIDNPRALFNIQKGLAFVEGVRHLKSTYYLGFLQPSAFLYHTGNCRGEEQAMIMKKTKGVQHYGEDWLEVFVSGPSLPHHLMNITSRAVKQEMAPNGQVMYLHKVDVSLRKGEQYEIFTPKHFA